MRPAINEATTMKATLEEDLTAYGKAGFEGVELWWDKVKAFLNNNTVQQLSELLSGCGLEAASICPFLMSPFRNSVACRDEFLKALDVAEEIGAPLIIVCPDFQPAGMTRAEAMKKLCSELGWYSHSAGQRGLRIAVEPIGRHSLIPGPKEALELIADAGNPDNTGILLDTFHYARSNVTTEEIEQIPLDRLFIVHANDSEPGALDELGDGNRVYPTTGVLELKSTVDALSAIGYKGFVSVEIFREEYWAQDIDDVARRSLKYLNRMLAL